MQKPLQKIGTSLEKGSGAPSDRPPSRNRVPRAVQVLRDTSPHTGRARASRRPRARRRPFLDVADAGDGEQVFVAPLHRCALEPIALLRRKKLAEANGAPFRTLLCSRPERLASPILANGHRNRLPLFHRVLISSISTSLGWTIDLVPQAPALGHVPVDLQPGQGRVQEMPLSRRVGARACYP